MSAASFLEKLSPIITLKTTCPRRCNNVARNITNASAKNKLVSGGHREGVGTKCRATASARKHNASCITPICDANYYDENQGHE
ncbi:hypothetical protein TNCV_1760301 [Trichonephila clavipes]|nr:hypothetical protein TNCV_1760301 [Trichonephila clavipes]